MRTRVQPPRELPRRVQLGKSGPLTGLASCRQITTVRKNLTFLVIDADPVHDSAGWTGVANITTIADWIGQHDLRRIKRPCKCGSDRIGSKEVGGNIPASHDLVDFNDSAHCIECLWREDDRLLELGTSAGAKILYDRYMLLLQVVWHDCRSSKAHFQSQAADQERAWREWNVRSILLLPSTRWTKSKEITVLLNKTIAVFIHEIPVPRIIKQAHKMSAYRLTCRAFG